MMLPALGVFLPSRCAEMGLGQLDLTTCRTLQTRSLWRSMRLSVCLYLFPCIVHTVPPSLAQPWHPYYVGTTVGISVLVIDFRLMEMRCALVFLFLGYMRLTCFLGEEKKKDRTTSGLPWRSSRGTRGILPPAGERPWTWPEWDCTVRRVETHKLSFRPRLLVLHGANNGEDRCWRAAQ